MAHVWHMWHLTIPPDMVWCGCLRGPQNRVVGPIPTGGLSISFHAHLGFSAVLTVRCWVGFFLQPPHHLFAAECEWGCCNDLTGWREG